MSQRKHKKENKLKSQVLSKALKATRCGVLVTDPSVDDNPIVFANQAFCEMTGYERDEVLGKNCRFLQGGDRRQSCLSDVRNALRTYQPCTVIVRNYKKNGELFFNELTISPLVEKSGKLTNFVGIQRDVTAEVQLNRQKYEFLATLLHDVKTPLLADVRIVEHVKNSDNLSKSAASLLECVKQNDLALLRLIDNTIDYYRLENIEIPSRTYYDVRQQILRCLEQFSSTAMQKDVDVTIGSEPLIICADYRLFERLMSNLLELAIKYSPAAGRVKVKMSERGGFAEVEFSNRSSLLPAKYLNLPGDLTLSAEEENGTTLAVHAAKRIIEMHGGTLSLARLNKVTTYLVRLPVKTAAG